MGATDYFQWRCMKEIPFSHPGLSQVCKPILLGQAQPCSLAKSQPLCDGCFLPQNPLQGAAFIFVRHAGGALNTEMTISMSLACTYYTHLSLTPFVDQGPSQHPITALLQRQKENTRTHQTAFKIHYVMACETAQSWSYSEYLYRQ